MFDDVGGGRVFYCINHVSNSSHFDNCVSVDGAITGNVANCPNSLFYNFLAFRLEEMNEKRNSPLIDNGLALAKGSRSNIGQSPSRL